MSKAKRQKSSKLPRLTAKQQRFVEEYLLDLNATRAAIAATYSAKCAAEIGYENLRKPQIVAAIKAGFLKKRERTEVSADFVIDGLVRNFRRAMQEVPVLDHDGKPTGQFVYQGNVANRALELLGKYLGMFVDRVALEGPQSFTVIAAPAPDQNPRLIEAAVVDSSSNGHGSNGLQ